MMNIFDETIDQEFEKAVFFSENRVFILFEPSFKQILFDFFTRHKDDSYEIHDKLFENFGIFWRNADGSLKSLQLCDIVFNRIIFLVHEWENNNNARIHKGTPYYFYGTICILKGDLDKGLLLMHQAYEEDKKSGIITPSRPTPAECFITLDDRPQAQFFRQRVIETVTFLEEKLKNYRNKNGTSLQINDLRSKFLEKSCYDTERFFFVYCIFKLEKIIKEIQVEMRKSTLASHIETSLIFEICKLVEVLLSKITANKDLFLEKIDEFCRDTQVGLALRTCNLNFLNEERDKDFKNTITKLINHTYSHEKFIDEPSSMEFDIALTYCLRNFGGHKIEEQNIICENFPQIVQNIFNSLFFIIEKKYS